MYRPHRAVLGETLWRQLCSLAPELQRPSGSTLMRQGEPGTHVVALSSGATTVILTGAEGESTLLAVRGAGELFGELSVLDGQPRSASVIAVRPCRVHVIAGPAFKAFVTEHQLLDVMLRHAIARVRTAETVRLELATAPVSRRLASALCRLVETAWPDAGSVPVEIPLTQEQLGQLIGASRKAVGTVISAWRSEGWVQTSPSGGLSIQNLYAVRQQVQRAM
ncbi:Crp/Fnr family transcriptional regulator [Streptomyces actuosus]|uniref:Crp/Fnr family transcriptional regulator n=1 Tax=Streptomyces actuosus TaxID=1885 RepID=A0A2U9PF05_STRAS|nr:Crp/Fnr family transcriptional regulator [Streptomyces actuosus]MBM4821282.1 Crp/Fnr family transcriptional regulator [Streptomyces actuosus]